MKKFLIGILTILTVVFIAACSSGADSSASSKKQGDKEELTSSQEAIELPADKFN